VEDPVVQITTTIPDHNEIIMINGSRLIGNQTALGSGFVYDKKGHIVTHSHVVPNNNYNKTGRSGGGTGNRVDVTFTEEKLAPLSITNSSDLQVGQQVVVIGNPFGLGETNVKFYVSVLSSLPQVMTALHIDLISLQ
jgi:S1-C subfamily serine protease